MIFLLAACLPIPYISPPADFTIAIDPVPATHVSERGFTDTGPSAIEVRAGLVPLGVVESMRDRTFDPTVGAVATIQRPSFVDSTFDVGGYGRLAVRAWKDELGSRTFAAAEPRLTVEVLAVDVSRPQSDIAAGFLVGALIRLGGWSNGELGAGFSAGSGGASGNIGVAYGEWGVALAADGGARLLPDGSMDTRFLLALELRAPASAGILLVPVF